MSFKRQSEPFLILVQKTIGVSNRRNSGCLFYCPNFNTQSMRIFKISLSIFFSLFAIFAFIVRVASSEYSIVGNFLSRYFGWILWMWVFIVFLLANLTTSAYLLKFKPNFFKASTVRMLWYLIGIIVCLCVLVYSYSYYQFTLRETQIENSKRIK